MPIFRYTIVLDGSMSLLGNAKRVGLDFRYNQRINNYRSKTCETIKMSLTCITLNM